MILDLLNGIVKAKNVLLKNVSGLESTNVQDALTEVGNSKLSLPKDSEGNLLNGETGQFAVSDGTGGVTWHTVVNGNEVAY